MSGFDLPNNFTDNPEALQRKRKARATSSSATALAVESLIAAPSATTATMAKSLREYSTPTVANMLVGPTVNVGNDNFELRTGLITMVQASQFCGLPSEDANTHL